MATAKFVLAALSLPAAALATMRAGVHDLADYGLVCLRKEGVCLARSAHLEMELEPGTDVFRANGENYDIDNRGRSYLFERDVRWTDQIGPVRDGRALEIERTFVEIRGGMKTSEEGESLSGPDWESEIDGRAVLFEWEADEDRYSARWKEDGTGEGEPLLAGLHASVDLQSLLPEGRVEVGDRWDLAPTALADVLVPLGDVALGTEVRETCLLASLSGFTMPLLPPVLTLWFGADADEITGDVEARLIEVSGDDGRQLAHIELHFDVRSEMKRTEWMKSRVPARFRSEIERYDLRVDLDGKAELVWDIEAGRAQNLEVRAEIAVRLDMLWTQSSSGGAYELVAELERSGKLEAGYDAEPCTE